MRLETAQVIDLLGISKEALRHWKTVLAPIAGRDGRSGGYGFSEVLALALIAEANRELDVPVSRFKDVAHRFFTEMIEVASLAQARDIVVCITRGDLGVHSLSELPPASALAVVRVDPILQRLRKRLSGGMREPEERQMTLDLVISSPTALAVRKVAQRRTGKSAAKTERGLVNSSSAERRQRHSGRGARAKA
jgi:hypothetical protein